MCNEHRSHDDLYDYLEDLDIRGLLKDDRTLRRFITGCCRLLWHELAPEVCEALELAECFIEDRTLHLTKMRVTLWHMADQFERALREDTADARVRVQWAATRAVICCLYERFDDSGDPYMTVDLVIDFCNIAVEQYQDQYAFLQELYGTRQ